MPDRHQLLPSEAAVRQLMDRSRSRGRGRLYEGGKCYTWRFGGTQGWARLAMGGAGVRLGRPKRNVDADKVATPCAQGVSWREIAARLGVGIGTVHRVAQGRSKKHSLAAPVSG